MSSLKDKPQFIADTMLLGLARWLRFLGFQTWYFHDKKDLVEHLRQRPKTIFLTSSVSHVEQFHPAHSFVLTEETIDKQLHIINQQYGIFQSIELLSLCTICNVPVETIDKMKVEGMVPTRVLTDFDQFWNCPVCQRVYWNGGHIKRLKEKMIRMKIPLP
jgi:uncharacterized protein with PIN domain